MRVRRLPDAVGSYTRRFGFRHRTAYPLITGIFAVIPALLAGGGTLGWLGGSGDHTRDAALGQGYDPGHAAIQQIAVDGTLPGAPIPLPLPAYELPDGPLGIPATALAAYQNAAGILGREQAACHIDWALIASIGRIESNHARGGYVDASGTTREPILGPQLNGQGGFAAIPDTDQGLLDTDPVWDRAVGPTQFIPGTWKGYASDGNGDGRSDPNNIYDAALATGRYLCSGGFDLAKPDQLRGAIHRYNNSDTYVNTVVLWADAYRNGIMQVPDSTVPIGAPNAALAPAPPSVPPPPVPTTTVSPPPPPTTGTSSTPPTSKPSLPCASPTTTMTTTTVISTTTTPPPDTTPPPPESTTGPPATTPAPTCGQVVTSVSTTTTTTTVGTTTPAG
ncbi:lytic transglycosylase domain-containing protein [Amycolatopsis sp. FBCC-B4732]|uniref:lytic transglycosylase domain-containing protein n=1 Tax=Amycolatopsis sp. FBCC-B4732 TaxID=3079339 RepID=UPI001FF25627|nr:lytic transglycosylase domain-containing protein [Amycolatopsis sp. FBCC-B4732]UOX88349.1 lytic transglycosylase domain-containing protein [Amycolatopsis sp. FBCC-B4732]